MTQIGLLDGVPALVDSRLDPEEKPRLARQCINILRLMLAHGSVTNTQLNEVAFRYSGRIFDLKERADIHIVITERNRESGVNVYGFKSDGDRERAERLLGSKEDA